MDAHTFAEAVNKLTPNLEGISRYEPAFIKKYLNFFRLPSKDLSPLKDQSVPAVVEVVRNYDVTSFEMMTFRFVETIQEDHLYIYFGQDEADDMVIEKSTGRVLLKEMYSDYIITPCAADSYQFLAALYHLTATISHVPFGTDLSDNQPYVCQIAQKCSQLAGGTPYREYYSALLGCQLP